MAVISGTNSYVTMEEAEAYFLQRLGADAWDGAVPSAKEAALVTATRLLDSMRWAGMAATDEQPLAFPRAITYFDPKKGALVTPTGVPPRVTNAQLELALHILNSPEVLSEEASVDEMSLAKLNLGKIRKAPTIPAAVLSEVRPLLVNQGANLVWRAN